MIEHLYAEIMFRGSIFSDEDIGSNIFDKVNETDDESGDPYPGNGYERLALAYRRECSNRLFDIFEEAAQASTSERSEEHADSMENC